MKKGNIVYRSSRKNQFGLFDGQLWPVEVEEIKHSNDHLYKNT